MSNQSVPTGSSKALASVADLVRRHGELAQASGEVIHARLELAASPHAMTPDGQAELARMIPEKAHALAHSGSEASAHFNAILLRAGSDWMREAVFVAEATTAMLTASSSTVFLRSQQDYFNGLASRMATAGNTLLAATTALQSAALAPVYRTAVSNAKRLKR